MKQVWNVITRLTMMTSKLGLFESVKTSLGGLDHGGHAVPHRTTPAAAIAILAPRTGVGGSGCFEAVGDDYIANEHDVCHS